MKVQSVMRSGFITHYTIAVDNYIIDAEITTLFECHCYGNNNRYIGNLVA